MTLQIPDGFGQIVWHISGPGATGVHHSVCTVGTGVPDQYTADEVVGFYLDAFAHGNIFGNMHNAYTLESVQLITPTEDVELVSGLVGSRSGAASPPTVATLIRKRSTLRGAHNRGRLYWPGLLLDTEVSDSGTITGSVVNDIQNTFDDYFAWIVDKDVQQFILHNDPAIDPTPISRFVVDSTIASQRRRLNR